MARFLEHYANRLLSPFVERCDDGSGVQFKGGSIHGSQVHLKCDALERALQGNADQPPLKLSLAHINKLQIDVPWTLSGDIEIAIDEMSVVVVQRDMRGTAGSLMELTENRVRIWMQHLFMAIKDGDSKLRFSNEEASALCQAEITRDRSKDNARRPKEGVGRRTSKLLLSMLRKLLGRCRPHVRIRKACADELPPLSSAHAFLLLLCCAPPTRTPSRRPLLLVTGPRAPRAGAVRARVAAAGQLLARRAAR
jgi:hypothetical protein